MPRRSADESARKETALEALHLAMRVTGRKQRPRPGKPGFEAVEQVMQWWRADWAERTPAQREADLRTASSWAKVRQRREAQLLSPPSHLRISAVHTSTSAESCSALLHT